jgi:quinol monooxygenase YgiN
MNDETDVPILVILKAKPEQRENLKAALRELVPPTRLEPGCLDYALFQLKETPDTFYVRESWRGQQALDTHVALPHFQKFAEKMEYLLAEPLQLVYLDPIEPIIS